MILFRDKGLGENTRTSSVECEILRIIKRCKFSYWQSKCHRTFYLRLAETILFHSEFNCRALWNKRNFWCVIINQTLSSTTSPQADFLTSLRIFTSNLQIRRIVAIIITLGGNLALHLILIHLSEQWRKCLTD
jgi:hypothetical protein